MNKWNFFSYSLKLRIVLLTIFIILVYTFIGIRIVQVGFNDTLSSKKVYSKSKRSRLEIVDRTGQLLAINIATSSLYANPKKIIDKDLAIKQILKTLPELDSKKLTNDIFSDKNFIWIKRDIKPDEAKKVLDLGIVGIDFEQEEKRIYPYGNITSHIVGFVNRDMKGLAGIEQYYDDVLSQRELVPKSTPLELSIDVRLQTVVHEELQNALQKFRAIGAVGVVADTFGKIISMVSLPDFEPHNPSSAPKNNLFNRASLGVYELGSVMKVLTFAIGLDSGTTTLNDVYNLDNTVQIAKFQVKDYHKAWGWHSVAEIFMNSSNIGTAQIALEMGKKTMQNYLGAFKLNQQINLDIAERAFPLYPKSSKWTDITTVTVSYGYGISLSPLHFVQAVIPTVNGGCLYDLSFSLEKNTTCKKILKEKTSSDMNKLMRLVVKEGTGKKAGVLGYLVGGKTGTANKSNKGRYEQSARISSFVAAFPAINPKYVVFVMLDEPKGIQETYGFATAGFTAAPVVGNIISRITELYDVESYEEDSEEVLQKLHLEYKIKGNA